MSNKPATVSNATHRKVKPHQTSKRPHKRGSCTSSQNKKKGMQPPKFAPIEFIINGLSHDGRGVAVYNEKLQPQYKDKQGKKVFVNFALPHEQVKVQLTNIKKNYEEGDAIQVIANPNTQRQQPFCQHFGKCGGCSLQHWQADGQIAFKQSVLAEHLLHQAGVEPDNWLSPIVGDGVGYRTKARLGVRYLFKNKPSKKTKGKVILGFRERGSNRLINIDTCPVLDKRIDKQLPHLNELLASLDGACYMTHIEVAVGEQLPHLLDGDNPVAMIIRHVKPLSQDDVAALSVFFKQRNWQLYLQPKGIESIHRVDVNESSKKVSKLYYQLEGKFGQLTYEFAATDFTQVNPSVNKQMVIQACDLLGLQTGERVLDLFSGLGNFSLPMAKMVGGEGGKNGLVVGVEGSDKMTQRAKDNAKRNGLSNTQFVTQDLTQNLSQCDWANTAFDALLIDPPRAGAWEVMQYIPKFNAKRIVYVSCDPATLARDTKALIENGYRLTHAGVMDMFCHTAHVESMLRFEKQD